VLEGSDADEEEDTFELKPGERRAVGFQAGDNDEDLDSDEVSFFF
jgi:hypothetical protein